MKWWVIAIVVVAIAWWWGHCHLMAKLRRVARRTLGGGCGGAIESQTNEMNSFTPALGKLPTSTGDGGPASLAIVLPSGADTHGCGCQQ